jgi:predicted MFS family arabinose efflux permease
MALTAEVDKVGRFVAMIPASEALGSALGPVVTGFALELSGVPTMIAVAAAAFVGGAVILAYVDRKELAVFGPGSPGSKGSPGTAKS